MASDSGLNNFPPNIQAALQQAADHVPRSNHQTQGYAQHRGFERGRYNDRGHRFAAYQHSSYLHGPSHSAQASQPLPSNPHPSPYRQHDFPPLSSKVPDINNSRTSPVNLTPPPRPMLGWLPQVDGGTGQVTSPMALENQPRAYISEDPRDETFASNRGLGTHRGSYGRGFRGGRGGQLSPYGPSHSRGSRGGQYQQPRLFNPHAQSPPRTRPGLYPPQQIVIQAAYLDNIASRELQKSITPKEVRNHEIFRKKMERILQDMVKEWAKDNVTVNPAHVRLRCYGSMASGFAVPGSDMDLMLMFPKDEGPVGVIETECRRMLEKRLLDEGYGARLLTKTRVPILRVCQSPGQDLLDDLRAYRIKSLDQEREEAMEKKMKELGLKASRLPNDPGLSAGHVEGLDLPASIPLPPSPTRENQTIEFDKTVGIQCDINFSNYVAVHNTRLLRCYCICDDRVRQMGLVVKAWVKARDVNTPYYGTLSSYGYILMVLHYLMNVANPPVIPNLQIWAKAADSRKENPKDVPLFEGLDIRFMGDEALLKRMADAGELTQNRESIGSLLRGFFQYYADPRGFHFGQEVISIRTQGGILRKAAKGWTEAKRTGADNSIRLRYLLCIEDPFEIEHNVARTVGHHGIVAIRDEFRRAWDILNKIEFTQGVGWQWRKPDGSIGDDLFAPVQARGDLLKKDAEYTRERIRAAAKLKQDEAEAQKELEPTQTPGTEAMSVQDHREGLTPQATGVEQGAKAIGSRLEDPTTDVLPIANDQAIDLTTEGGVNSASNEVMHGGKKTRVPRKRGRNTPQKHRLTEQNKVVSSKDKKENSPGTASTITSSSVVTPEIRMPSSPLSSLSFPFDPNQLRDMQLIIDGGNGCARGPRGYDFEGIFGTMGARKLATD